MRRSAFSKYIKVGPLGIDALAVHLGALAGKLSLPSCAVSASGPAVSLALQNIQLYPPECARELWNSLILIQYTEDTNMMQVDQPF